MVKRLRDRSNVGLKIDDVEQFVSVTYATWNPSDKAATYTLSNGDLSYACSNSTRAALRATIGKSSGKRYWEIINSGVAPSMTGVGNSSMSLSNFVGNDSNGWSYYTDDGGMRNNNSVLGSNNTYTAGDTIGLALDMDNGTLKVYKNNTLQTGYSFSGLSGTLYPAGSGFSGNTVTANFGATTMAYTAPSGYNQGVYS